MKSQGHGQGHKSTFGMCNTFGRSRSVYKSDVEYRFLSPNGQMTLKVKVNGLHFQYQLGEFQDAYLVQIPWFYLKSITSYCMDKPNFLEF